MREIENDITYIFRFFNQIYKKMIEKLTFLFFFITSTSLIFSLSKQTNVDIQF